MEQKSEVYLMNRKIPILKNRCKECRAYIAQNKMFCRECSFYNQNEKGLDGDGREVYP